jgi:RsiW-degrading membrane proteinase PrsW (M82 family)
MAGIEDPKILGFALLGGFLPAIFWLWFWLREDKDNPNPNIIITICFILGMISVILVLPIQSFLNQYIHVTNFKVIALAGAEELIKFLIILVVLFRTKLVKEPLDWPIYIITGALGFAALENMLFIIKPLSENQPMLSIMTSQLRFLGSTLLHAVASGIIGISLGLSFFLNNEKREMYFFFGLIFSTALHSVFNFLIIKNNGSDFLRIFVFLWVATIINILLFEKLRRMGNTTNLLE